MNSAESITNRGLREALGTVARDLDWHAVALPWHVPTGDAPVPDDAPVWQAISEARNLLSELLARRLDAPGSEG